MAVKTIGIIGAGAVGSMLAERWSMAGYIILASDANPEKLRGLGEEVPAVQAVPQNEAVQADLVVFCVPADNLEDAVANAAPHVGPHTIISGQSSVKTPEVAVFSAYFLNNPKVPMHSWHAPPQPAGQTLFIIDDIAPSRSVAEVEEVCKALGSNIRRLPWQMHDRLSADKQFLTHLAYLSMMRTWTKQGFFPWENSGIDAVKATIGLGIISGEEHVYRNVAMLNPFVPAIAMQYAKSVTELHEGKDRASLEILLSSMRDMFSSGFAHAEKGRRKRGMIDACKGTGRHVPNSHLSLLGVADTWASLGICPDDRFMANTPPSRLLQGIVEYVCTRPVLLEECMKTLLIADDVRLEDAAFVRSAWEWAEAVVTRDHVAYTAMFNEAKSFFTAEQLKQAKQRRDEMFEILKPSH